MATVGSAMTIQSYHSGHFTRASKMPIIVRADFAPMVEICALSRKRSPEKYEMRSMSGVASRQVESPRRGQIR